MTFSVSISDYPECGAPAQAETIEDTMVRVETTPFEAFAHCLSCGYEGSTESTAQQAITDWNRE
jgi:hypothetical protein